MIETLKKKIYNTTAFKNINLPDTKTDQFFIDGLRGSLRAFFVTYLVEVLNKPVVFLTSDPDSAEKMRDDLEILLTLDPIVFFPTEEKTPYDDHDPNPSLQRLRLETLQSLMGTEKGVVVSTLQGLMGRVPSPESFVDGQYYFEKNQTCQHQKLIENLHSSGYARTEIVEDVGHFAVRGGIIDIFPWTSDDPVRVEFFGDKIESIRSFNIISQRSIEEAGKVEILPAIDHDKSADTLFDYLPLNSIFIVEDYKDLALRSVEYEELIIANYTKLLEEDVYPIPPKERYFLWNVISKKMSDYQLIHFGLLSDKKYKTVQFQSTTPPTFAGHLNRLFSYLRKSKKDQLFTLIQCDTKVQAERIEEILVDEEIDDTANITSGALHDGFVYPDAGIQVLTDHEIFDRFKKRRTYQRFKNGEYLRSLSSLNLNDYVVHIQYGIGRYLGLETLEVSNIKKECIKLQYADGDVLFVSVDRLNNVQKYASEDESLPGLTNLNSGEWERLKKRTRESIEKVAAELLELQAARKAEKGYAFTDDTHWQRELEASFPYDETEDQLKSIEEVKLDLQSDVSMDRLLCGDVGYGKTEVAIRAAFKVVMEGKQVAILVPTTILAYQHFHTFRERMSEFPVHIEMLSRFRTPKQQKAVLEKLNGGEIDIIIGTHRLLSDDVQIKNIGLLVIDEEQRFGVKHKEKLKKLRVTVDVLTLTATPIPRTMHLALMGARDLSNIETPPRNRLPVITEIHEWDDDLIYRAITRELDRHGQVYFVHNRVKTIKGMEKIIKEIVPSS